MANPSNSSPSPRSVHSTTLPGGAAHETHSRPEPFGTPLTHRSERIEYHSTHISTYPSHLSLLQPLLPLTKYSSRPLETKLPNSHPNPSNSPQGPEPTLRMPVPTWERKTPAERKQARGRRTPLSLGFLPRLGPGGGGGEITWNCAKGKGKRKPGLEANAVDIQGSERKSVK